MNDKFYTYKIYDPVNNMYYIGSRCRKGTVDPYEDSLYMGTVTSKKWKKLWPEIIKRSEKYILGVFLTREEALAHEAALHEEYNVAVNPKYYNQAKQLGTKFTTAGTKLTEEHKKKLRGPRYHIRGESSPLYGRKNKKHGEFMSKRTGEKASAYKHDIYVFKHDDFGIFKGTMGELRVKYNLKPSNLTAVINGRRKSINGWKLVK